MPNTVIGRILSIGQTVNVSKKENPFLKRDLVLDCSYYTRWSGEKIENYVQLHFQQDGCKLLDGYKEGELVEVTFGLNGRPYESKYIMDIIGFRIERKQVGAASPAAAPAQAAPAPQVHPEPQNAVPADDSFPPQGEFVPF